MVHKWNHLEALAQTEIQETIDSLPAKLRTQARALPVTYARRPSRAMLKDGIESDTLGLFVGGPFPDNDMDAEPLPPQILLFLENLWELAEGDDQVYREEIRTTLLHELGHYLGLNETDLEDRGLE